MSITYRTWQIEDNDGYSMCVLYNPESRNQVQIIGEAHKTTEFDVSAIDDLIAVLEEIKSLSAPELHDYNKGFPVKVRKSMHILNSSRQDKND